jgi:hypothetical protein
MEFTNSRAQLSAQPMVAGTQLKTGRFFSEMTSLAVSPILISHQILCLLFSFSFFVILLLIQVWPTTNPCPSTNACAPRTTTTWNTVAACSPFGRG